MSSNSRVLSRSSGARKRTGAGTLRVVGKAGRRGGKMFESLEGRRLLSVSISGDPTVQEGANYRLNLSATDLPAAVQDWTINWGDGNVEVIAGNPAFADHVYDDDNLYDGQATKSILAHVTTVDQQTFPAQGPPGFAGNPLDAGFGFGGVLVTAAAGAADVVDVAPYPGGGYVTVGNTEFQEWQVKRYTANGALDPSFDVDGVVTFTFNPSDAASDFARALAIDASGRIVIAGVTRGPGANTHTQFALARLTAGGAPDAALVGTAGASVGTGKIRTAFGTASGDAAGANDVAIQSDGKIVAAGNSRQSSDTDFALVRYNDDGTLDAGFGSGGTSRSPIAFSSEELAAIALRTDAFGDTIGIVGAGSRNGGDFAVALFGANGVLDGSFGGGTGLVVTDFGGFTERATDAVITGGAIVVAGNSSANNGRVALARYDFNGGLDSAFGSAGKVTTLTAPFGPAVASLSVQPDGKLVVGATLTNTTSSTPAQTDDNSQGFGLFRYNVDGSADSSFGVGGKIYTHVGKASVAGLSGGHALLQANGQILQVGTQPDDPTGFGANGPTDAVAYRFGVPAGLDVFVQNVAPVIVNAPAVRTVPGFAQPFTFGVTDVSTADTVFASAFGYEYLINFGDGSLEQFYFSGMPVTYAYADYGNYTATVRAYDKDGGESDPVTFQVTVAAFSLQDDPVYPGKQMLVIGGAQTANNVVTVRRRSGLTEAIIDGVSTGRISLDGRIVVFGGAGNDYVQVASTVSVPVELYGGPGVDLLRGGSHNDIIVGGDGIDLVVGGAGRDLLIGDGPFEVGKTGSTDRIVGYADDDILIGGYFIGSEDRPTLKAVMDVWGDTALTYGQRVDALSTTLLIADNGAASTVFDDNAVDVLTGSAGQDWFFANADAANRDYITDLGANEFANDLDFISWDDLTQ